jgi:exonuclease SbcC
MILKNLTLKNFRKFKNTTIEFPDGLTGVVGLNGSGKSTIFEAIAWVLYGPVAARTSADQIKHNGASNSEPCRVELEFVFEDNNYRLIREMSGKSLSASATATINGKIAATGAETVSKFIQKKLSMDFKSFFTSIFAKQKELNALSSMIASERRPLILKMLGIDSLDDVIKEIKSDKKDKDTLLQKLNQDLIDENGKEKIDIHREKIKNFEEQKKEIEKTIKQLQEKNLVLKKDLKKLEKNYLDTKKEYEKINERKENLTDKKILFENKNKLQDEIKILKQKVDNRQKIIKKEKQKLENFKNLENDIKFTEKHLNEIDDQIEKNIKKIEQKKTLLEKIRKDFLDINYKKKDIKKLGPNAECPTCERVLSDQYSTLLKKFEKDEQKFEKEIESFSKEIKQEQDEKDKLSREQQAFKKKKNYLLNQLREKERIDTTVSNISLEFKREKKELEKKEAEIKKIGVVTFDLKEFNNVKKQVDVLYKKHQSLLDIFTEKKDNLAELNLSLEKKGGNKKLISQEIKNLKEKILQLENYKNQIKNEKKTVHYLDMLSEVMASFRTHLISRIRPTLSSYSSDFFERLTDGKYRELSLDENYNLLVYDDGNVYGIERFSGGEEDLANLCLRLAISEVITERAGGVFNFIILDEIFGSQDVFRRQNIMKALNALSSKFRQIFLITHVDDVKNDMENIIFVTENEEGISSVEIK